MKKLEDYTNIWIDLTDFMDWQGHFTGIQRVEYELASRFKKLENVRFFYYHPIKSAFIETDFSVIDEKSKVASGETVLSEKDLSRQVPLSRRVVTKMKEAVPHNTRMKLVKMKSQVQKMSENSPLDPSHPFTSEDLVLVLGGNWAFATFMPSLEKVKKAIPELKSVHVLYDFIPVIQPGFFPEAMEKTYSKYIKKVLKVSDLSLSISEHTRTDALAYALSNAVKHKPIKAFRLGDDFVKIDSHKPRNVKVKSKKYIFCVGTFEVRKNHQLLYYALKLAQEKSIELPEVVIVGKKGWLSDSTLHLFENDPAININVTILHKCSDKEMAWLYENCLFTVYPSYYEGWGLPIAESLSYNKVCLSSNSSSMPEVAGELVSYFSPYDSGEFLSKIIYYLDPDQLLDAETTIKKQYKKTTWDDTFKETITTIEKELR